MTIVGSACLQNSTPFEEMVENDFYAYALADEVALARGWQVLAVDKHNWEAHCLPGPSAPWNPTTVTYLDENDDKQLSIRVSDRDLVWDRGRDTVTVPIHSRYALEGTGIGYSDSEISSVKFTDTFGNDVVVDALLSVEEISELIESFQYIGPEMSELVNPWTPEWCKQK